MASTDNRDTIITDAEAIFKNNGKRFETLFFKAVLGGANSLVAEVLNIVKAKSEKKSAPCYEIPDNNNQVNYIGLYHWMLGVHDAEIECGHPPTTVKPGKDKIRKLIKSVILVPLWIILTPFFYIFHSLIHAVLNSKLVLSRYCISKYHQLEFPLAFAVFSGEDKMVETFLGHLKIIELVDGKRNNVMHYLADLSAYDLPKAMKAYDMLWRMADQGCIKKRTLKDMLAEENIHKQNAVEYCCQFGGLKLACKMIDNAMVKEMAVIENNEFYFTHKRNKANNNPAKLTNNDKFPVPGNIERAPSSWAVKQMNVTKYEVTLRHGFTSMLLHLITSRPTMEVSKENWEEVQKHQGIRKWMKCKFQQWGICPIGFIMTGEFLITALLIFFLVFVQGDLVFTPNKEKFVKKHTENFLDFWLQDNSSGINTDLRTSFFSEYSDLEQSLEQDNNTMDYVEMLDLIKKLDGYQNYSFSNLTGLYNQLCVTGSQNKKVGDLISMDKCTSHAADSLLTDCRRPGSKYSYYFPCESWNKYEFAIGSSFRVRIFNDSTTMFKNILEKPIPQGVVNLFHFLLLLYFGIYIFLDIYCRLFLLMKQISSDFTYYSIFATSHPGSYVKGICNISGGLAYILLISYHWDNILDIYGPKKESNLQNEILTFDRFDEDYLTTNLIISYVQVLMCVSRIILHLNALRILPIIGNFVITTFEMATDLFQFTVVYLLIVSNFAAMFYWYNRSTECPFFRKEDHIDMLTSMFTTFAVTFGHVDTEFSNPQLKLVYIVFVGLSIILLLNLIIAVMNSTASLVTVEPWQSQLYKEAIITEALGLDHWMKALFPCTSRVVWSLERVGFVKNKKEVYIKFFEETFVGQ